VQVIPDVRNLVWFAGIRRRLFINSDAIDVASLGDAALRFIARTATTKIRQTNQAGCRVVAIGKAGYFHKSNAIRKAVLDVSANTNTVVRYRILQQVFPNRLTRTVLDAVDGSAPMGKFRLPTGRGRIADNLMNDRPWYRNLFEPLAWDNEELKRLRISFKKKYDRNYSLDVTWFLALSHQRFQLMRLISEEAMWDSEAEQVFERAMHETLRGIYRQEKKASERGGSRDAKKRWEQKTDEIRRQLLQAKTRDLVREVLAGLIALAGRQKTVQEYAGIVWRFINHPDHWMLGRDLALLALASYKPKTKGPTQTEPAKGGMK
jgi:CRISPR-associated protein Cas8a1/Csx13